MTEKELKVQLALGSLSINDIRQLAENSNTPPKILEILSRDKRICVKRSVAKNPNTSPEILEILSQDEIWHVRENVAKNPNTEAF